MAGAAIGQSVLASQRIVRGIVLESRDVHPQDVCFAAEVFGVARAAFCPINGRQAPMKADLGAHIGGDVLVTIEAESRLPPTVAAVVAIGTVLFEFGVCIRYLAWHEQGLYIGGIGARTEEGSGKHND